MIGFDYAFETDTPGGQKNFADGCDRPQFMDRFLLLWQVEKVARMIM